MSLAQKALGGFFWTSLSSFGSHGIQFVVLIVLARLLTPADFGLIAMLMVFFLRCLRILLKADLLRR
jgi:teichuronic acid exporter